jgi:hypothetical protein
LCIESLKNKSGNNDFLALLKANGIFGITESWAGFQKFDVRDYISMLKGGVELRNLVETQEA